MTPRERLRDALAVCLAARWPHRHRRSGGSLVVDFSGIPLAIPYEEEADAILSDPALRKALAEAVAEALHVVQFDSPADHHDEADARAIVARMLSTGSEGAGGGG